MTPQEQTQIDAFQAIHDWEPTGKYRFEVEKEGDSYYAALFELENGQWIATLNTAGNATPEQAIYWLFFQRRAK